MFLTVLGQLPPDNCPPDNCYLDDCPPDNCPRTIAPEYICPQENYPSPPENCPLHPKISPKNNRPHSSKFPSKSTTSELRKAMHCLRVL